MEWIKFILISIHILTCSCQTPSELGIILNPADTSDWSENMASGSGNVGIEVISVGSQTGFVSVEINITRYGSAVAGTDYLAQPTVENGNLPLSAGFSNPSVILVRVSDNQDIDLGEKGFTVYLMYNNGNDDVITSLTVLLQDDDACAGGAYYNNVTSQCENCTLGKWSSGGVPLQFSCTPCDQKSTTLAIAANSHTQCVCEAGYFFDADDNCTVCPLGQWKSVGNGTTCNDCPENQTTVVQPATNIDHCGSSSAGGSVFWLFLYFLPIYGLVI